MPGRRSWRSQSVEHATDKRLERQMTPRNTRSGGMSEHSEAPAGEPTRSPGRSSCQPVTIRCPRRRPMAFAVPHPWCGSRSLSGTLLNRRAAPRRRQAARGARPPISLERGRQAGRLPTDLSFFRCRRGGGDFRERGACTDDPEDAGEGAGVPASRDVCLGVDGVHGCCSGVPGGIGETVVCASDSRDQG
jgi:hypothetical protein